MPLVKKLLLKNPNGLESIASHLCLTYGQNDSISPEMAKTRRK
jgi:hypothetical protein